MRKSLADQLRAFICEFPGSRTTLAEEAGVDAGVLSRFLSGERTMTLEVADRLAALLGLHLAQEKQPMSLLTRKRKSKRTTVPGYVNANHQENLGCTGSSGTDHRQYVYRMKCLKCGTIYGSNGSDIFQRRCPGCQGGKPGPSI